MSLSITRMRLELTEEIESACGIVAGMLLHSHIPTLKTLCVLSLVTPSLAYCRPAQLHAHQAGHDCRQQGAARPGVLPLQPHPPLAHWQQVQGGLGRVAGFRGRRQIENHAARL